MYDRNQNGRYGAGSDWWKWFLFAIVVGVCLPIGIVIAIIALFVG